ncbi:MAG: PAS domain S-box protein [Nitratireductor sp.]|nr:PAS domain S-box protein [Nitratireductor sp.]
MTRIDYSFLDLTVLPFLRRLTISQDAAILFSVDLDRVLWANAFGVRLFSGDGLADLLETSLSPSHPLIRQIGNAIRQVGDDGDGSEDGDDAAPIVRRFRINHGLKSELIHCEISRQSLPGGEPAVLVTCPRDAGEKRLREFQLAEAAVEALDDMARAAAILDDYGLVLAASGEFEALDIEPMALEALVRDGDGEADRMVKRLIETVQGERLPAGLGKIRDRPARFLVIIADNATSDEAAVAETAAMPQAVLPSPEALEADLPPWADEIYDGEAFEVPDGEAETEGDLPVDEPPGGTLDATADTTRSTAPASAGRSLLDRWYFDGVGGSADEDRPAGIPSEVGDGNIFDRVSGRDGGQAGSAGPDDPAPLEAGWESAHAAIRDQGVEDPYEAEGSMTEEYGAEADDIEGGDTIAHWPADTSQAVEAPDTGAWEAPARDGDDETRDEAKSDRRGAVQTSAETPVKTPVKTPAENEVERFAFTIDRDQVVRSVTDGLARIVGPHSGDLAGRHWADIASERGFDENGRILALLSSGDTWSGRTVLWPIEGTDMSVPVDLAALPAYDRDRNFDGFRGFGVVRVSDAVVDPGARGLRLGDGGISTPDASGGGAGGGEALEAHRTGWRTDLDSDLDEDMADDAAAARDGAETPADMDSAGSNVYRLADRREPEPHDGSRGQTAGAAAEEGSGADGGLSGREQRNFSEIRRSLHQSGEMGEAEPDQTADMAAADDDEEADSDLLNAALAALDRRTDEAADRRHEDEAEVAALSGIPGGYRDDFGDETMPAAPEGGDDDEGDDGSEDGAGLLDAALATIDETDEAGPAEDAPEPDAPMPGPAPSDADIHQLAPAIDPEGAALILKGGETLFATRALLVLTGFDSAEALEEAGGLPRLLMTTGELAAADAAAPDAGLSLRDNGFFLRHRDGHAIAVRARLTSVDWRGRPALSLAFAQTGRTPADQKVALDMMRVSELETILETAADGIVLIEADDRIQSINASGEALFGRTQDSIAGRPFTELFATENHKALTEYASAMRSRDGNRFNRILHQGSEAIGLEANGGMIPLFATIGRAGTEGGLCLVLRDLSHWKRAEKELVAARKEAETASEHKTRFLSRVSHEIREPLTAIIGFSDIMLEERFGPVGSHRYKDYLKDINRSGIHVLDLVNDLLDISRIEAGKLDLSFEAADLNRIAAETIALLEPQSNRKRIIVRTALSPAVPKVVADTRSMRQILLNLAGNAINHSPENTQVIVSTTLEENGEVSLRVRDNGQGMSAAEIERALHTSDALADFGDRAPPRADAIRPVSQGAASRQHGLGLPLTKALVEANRAYFELESVPGEGTVAHVIFPSQRVLAD